MFNFSSSVNIFEAFGEVAAVKLSLTMMRRPFGCLNDWKVDIFCLVLEFGDIRPPKLINLLDTTLLVFCGERI